MMASVLCLADRDREAFSREQPAISVVCAGDSLTGWNNLGPMASWPYPCYPQFLQEMRHPLGLNLANCGMAGEVSGNGIGQVKDYLGLFPNARWFIIGFGTNDLGIWPDVERTSRDIIGNLGSMMWSVKDRGKRPLLFNVPYANESRFIPHVAKNLHAKRDYHNAKLKEYCDQRGVPVADIGSRLRDEHFADELHPNKAGARIIAEEVFKVLRVEEKGGRNC
jgi:lysophospholipase L1-like esterase